MKKAISVLVVSLAICLMTVAGCRKGSDVHIPTVDTTGTDTTYTDTLGDTYTIFIWQTLVDDTTTFVTESIYCTIAEDVPAAVTAVWDFGDGATSALSGHAYATPGVYTIKVTLTDTRNGKTHVSRQHIVIRPFITSMYTAIMAGTRMWVHEVPSMGSSVNETYNITVADPSTVVFRGDTFRCVADIAADSVLKYYSQYDNLYLDYYYARDSMAHFYRVTAPSPGPDYVYHYLHTL